MTEERGGVFIISDEPMTEGPLLPRMIRSGVATTISIPIDPEPNPHRADLTRLLEERWLRYTARTPEQIEADMRQAAAEAVARRIAETARLASLRTVRVRLTAEALVQVPMEWDEGMIAAAVRGRWLEDTEARGVEVVEEAPEDDTGAIELDEGDLGDGG